MYNAKKRSQPYIEMLVVAVIIQIMVRAHGLSLSHSGVDPLVLKKKSSTVALIYVLLKGQV